MGKNKFLQFLFLFLMVVDYSFVSTSDHTKSMLTITYDDGSTDKLLIDNKDLNCYDCIVNAVNQILNKRKAQ
jgi:hypothetical protein